LKDLEKTIVHSYQLKEEDLWQTKPVLFQSLKQNMERIIGKYGKEHPPPPFLTYTLPHKPGPGNLHLVQKVFEGAFEFDIIFNSKSSGKTYYSRDVSAAILSTQQSFFDRFVATFNTQYPFSIESFQRFSTNMFSNLIGGLGYFHGDSIVDRSYAPEYEEENEGFVDETAAARSRREEKLEGPTELLTTVPSRPFFPRGFLWDEGFHLLPIVDWDLDLTLEVVKSWFNLMDDDGWIGREQILGQEARSKVPAEFQVQYPHYANPPTLFFIVDEFIAKLGALNGTAPPQTEKIESNTYSRHLESTELAMSYLAELYPKLKKHYEWFRKTQKGDLKSYDRQAFSTKEGYRWRGRSVQHILTSGLDDYPRPQPPHPGELHVDLISWMGMMTKSLKNVAKFLDYKDDVAELNIIEEAILKNIDDLHWSEKDKVYCDATIDDYEENSLVCHKGYISLFPFLLGLLDPKSNKLGALLELIGNEEELWSNYGLRSLSKKSEFFGTDENYWRGPIWININYLALTQLLVRSLYKL
jgi:mannosyl-oligosaccharide glucosidase